MRDRFRLGAWVSLGLSMALWMTLASRAQAHGRPASIGRLVEDPTQPGRRVARATWGLARSEGAGPWRWGCAASFGVDARSEDPAIVYARGALVLGTFGGLWRSDDHGCTWRQPSELLADLYVVDVVAVTPDRLVAVGATTGRPDRLFESLDAGRTWAELGADLGGVVVERLLAVDSVLFASGALAATGGGPREPRVLRSEDGGRTFASHAVPTEPGERGVVLWTAAPGDPDVLYAQMLHFNGEQAPERVLRSSDGGASWRTVLRLPYLGGLLATSEGVLAGSRLGGLYWARDGEAFELIDEELAVTCLAALSDGVHVCADPSRSGFVLGRWTGEGVEPTTRLADIDRPMACPLCSEMGAVCPAWEPDIIVDLGLDAALPPGFSADASTGAPRDAGLPAECLETPPPDGCACRAAGRGRHDPGALGAVLGLAIAWRARRRRARAAQGCG